MSQHRERIEFYLLIVAVFLLLIQVSIQSQELHEQKHINANYATQLTTLQNWTDKFNQTVIMNEIDGTLKKTDVQIKLYQSQALKANQIVDDKCMGEIAKIKANMATDSTKIASNTKITLDNFKNVTAAIKTNTDDINKISKIQGDNLKTLKSLDDNQVILTKRVQTLEDVRKNETQAIREVEHIEESSGNSSNSSNSTGANSTDFDPIANSTSNSTINSTEEPVAVDSASEVVDAAAVPAMGGDDGMSGMGGSISLEEVKTSNLNLILSHFDQTLARHRQNGIVAAPETMARYHSLLEQHGADDKTLSQFKKVTLEL